MSGGPYGPRGVLSDFEGGGEGGFPKVYNRTDPIYVDVANLIIRKKLDTRIQNPGSLSVQIRKL